MREQILSKKELGFIFQIPKDKIRIFAKEQYDKVKDREKTISEQKSEIVKLKKQLGIQEDGFKDTPSLNIIRFDKNGRPNCSEHGSMNAYEHNIYRCVMCGVAVQLNEGKQE